MDAGTRPVQRLVQQVSGHFISAEIVRQVFLIWQLQRLANAVVFCGRRKLKVYSLLLVHLAKLLDRIHFNQLKSVVVLNPINLKITRQKPISALHRNDVIVC
jgi:hypothetical protein